MSLHRTSVEGPAAPAPTTTHHDDPAAEWANDFIHDEPFDARPRSSA